MGANPSSHSSYGLFWKAVELGSGVEALDSLVPVVQGRIAAAWLASYIAAASARDHTLQVTGPRQ